MIQVVLEFQSVNNKLTNTKYRRRRRILVLYSFELTMNLRSNRYKARELHFLLFYLLIQTKTQMNKLVHTTLDNNASYKDRNT